MSRAGGRARHASVERPTLNTDEVPRRPSPAR
jgi:hypothetical protein